MPLDPDDFKRAISAVFERVDEAIQTGALAPTGWDASEHGQALYRLFEEQFGFAGKVKCYRITYGARNEAVRINQRSFHPDAHGTPVPVDLCIAWFSDSDIRKPGDSLWGVVPPHGPVLYICRNENGELLYRPRFFIWYPDSPLRQPMEELGARFVPFEEVFKKPDEEILIAHDLVEPGGPQTSRSSPPAGELSFLSLDEALKEVLRLQGSYSSDKTPEMERRGALLRLPVLKAIEDAVGADEPPLAVSASDGIGRKARIPWVRIYDPYCSPDPRTGWYLVYLFSADGDAVYLSLNQGTTRLEDGALYPLDPEGLDRRVSWARNILEAALGTPGLTTEMDLKDPGPLGPGYQRGHVLGIRYEVDAIPDEEQLIEDLRSMVGHLRTIYQQTEDSPHPRSSKEHRRTPATTSGSEVGEIDDPGDGLGGGSGDGSGEAESQGTSGPDEGMVVNDHVETLNTYVPFGGSDSSNIEGLIFEHSNLELQMEAKVLESLVRAVSEPGVRLVVLTGDAGHGKSHLCGMLLAELTGRTLLEARERLLEDENRGLDLAPLQDGRSLRVILDRSETRDDRDAGQVLDEAIRAEDALTVVCVNDGKLRACAGAWGLSDLLKLLDESVLSGQMRSDDGTLMLINLNHQSVVAETEKTNILRQVFESWVLDDEKWQRCDECPDQELCPTIANREKLAEGGAGDENFRLATVEILLRIAERTGHLITVRHLLMYLAYMLTGGLRCLDVHRRVEEDPGAKTWQWEYLFHQSAFGRLLAEEEISKKAVFVGVTKLDPANRAIRMVDDRFSDSEDTFGSFPSPFKSSGGSDPGNRSTRDREAEEHRNLWRFLRRQYFFEALAAPEEEGYVRPSHRVGLPHIEDFIRILDDSTAETEIRRIRNLLIRGLEAIQGVYRSGAPPAELFLVHPAFSARRGDTSVVGSRIRLGDISLMPRGGAWRRRSGSDGAGPEVIGAVDWIEGCVVLSLGGPEAPEGKCVELMLHEFEFLMTAARGLRSEEFFAAEIARLLRELGLLATGQNENDRLIVFSEQKRREYVLDGGTIQEVTD